jgi:hypothetical protein
MKTKYGKQFNYLKDESIKNLRKISDLPFSELESDINFETRRRSSSMDQLRRLGDQDLTLSESSYYSDEQSGEVSDKDISHG